MPPSQPWWETTKGTHKGKAFSGPYRATNFYLKRNGQWQLVSGQSSSITQ